MRLLLIRHGESASNAERRVQGHFDSPLSDRGRDESDLLAERLAAFKIDALYSSTLSRALQTAEFVARRSGLSIVAREELMERNVGELEGLTREEIQSRFPALLRESDDAQIGRLVPGWEPHEAFAERVSRALERPIGDHAGQCVAVVTHGGVLGQFCASLLGIDSGRPVPLSFANTSITTVDVRDGGAQPGRPARQLISLNDTCHLDGRA